MTIDPTSWLKKAISNAPFSVNPWNSGETSPNAPGWHERFFTDGLILHFWSGEKWLVAKEGPEHWRQVGSYPAWRELSINPL